MNTEHNLLFTNEEYEEYRDMHQELQEMYSSLRDKFMESTERLKKMEQYRNIPKETRTLLYRSNEKYYWNNLVQVRLIFDSKTRELVRFEDLVLPDISDLMDIYDMELAESFKTYITESCPDVFKLMQKEYQGRTEIDGDYTEEFLCICDEFNTASMRLPAKDCWCCKESVYAGLKCKNNHTDVLCGNCTFQLMSRTDEPLECGICRTPMNVTSKFIDKTTGVFEDIYPHLAVGTGYYQQDIDCFENINTDYKIFKHLS